MSHLWKYAQNSHLRNHKPTAPEEMDTAVSVATSLVGKVLNKLSDDLVAAYVASSELGLNSDQIKADLKLAHALLHEAQGRDDNPSLKWLLQQLSEKADEAEDALDKLHYFIIQDQLDGTRYALPDLGGDLQEKVQHGRNAVRHTIGNWLLCFSCCRTKDDDCAATAITSNPHNKAMSDSGNGSGHVDKLTFDRVAMSIKIKSVIEDVRSKCLPVSDLLKIPSHSSTSRTNVTLNRPLIGSTIVQDKLYGRSAIFEQTIKDITGGIYHGETLSVLPIVGPGGIGKTTFTQHLYNDTRTKEHFTVRVWVCVSTDFDVLKLTQQIHSCIPPTEKEDNNIASGTPNLDQLQISIAHRLKSKRFLIVLDDIWKCDSDVEWNNLLAPFTKGEAKGSMVLVTTRFPKIEARVKKATIPINLQGLEPEEFFKFFLACVFGENKPDQQYDELIEIGKEIAKKLKCSPLAAKTVAPLLKKHLSWEHWRKVLENNEWKNQANSDDIMPALKISYDYLPFYLKQCFSYFSLFPEDHRFKNLQITRFWTAIGIIDSSCKNKNYLEELVDNGFLMKKVGDDLEDQCYVMHDLLHELSRSVSSQECVNISSLSFRADAIPQSIRHLSITIEDRFDENFRKEMAKLKTWINIGNLRTLMIFRMYKQTITDILKDTFEKIEGLRVLFIVMTSSESLPKNFSKLLHLRYLKLGSRYSSEISLPCTVSRFYHLVFLDLEGWDGSSTLPKYISRLVNLRHFIAKRELHSNVPEVGKIEHLEELKEFHVKKAGVGFELSELGKLTDLGGELRICNLEKVATKEEASQANLALKRNLKSLTLVWGREKSVVDADVVDGLQPHDNPIVDADVVDGLQPHDNLRELGIIDHSGIIGPPNWLCRDITIKHLESLILQDVSWGILPPFGQLPYLKILRLKNITRVRFIGPDLNFMHLKEVKYINMPDLEKWILGPNCHLFPMLESIECKDCPNFLALPFLIECLVPCTQDIHYPKLSALCVDGCPKLSLPPMPHTSTLTNVKVSCDGLGSIWYKENSLSLRRYRGALAFHNMDKLERIEYFGESNIPWTELERLTSLKELKITENPSMQSMAPLSNLTSLTALWLIDCENLRVDGFNPLITAVYLKRLKVYNSENHPRRSVAADLLSEMAISADTSAAASSFQLEWLQVDSISAVLVAPICTLLAPTLQKLIFQYDDRRVDSLREEEEKALQLLTSLRVLIFHDCPGLPSLPQGLHSLPSLTHLVVNGCPGIRSLPNGGLPTSLTSLWVYDCPGIRSLPKGGLPTSLQDLTISGCPGIRSLPKGGLPTSLREITVLHCNPELKEQVDKLKGTNPDLRVDIY